LVVDALRNDMQTNEAVHRLMEMVGHVNHYLAHRAGECWHSEAQHKHKHTHMHAPSDGSSHVKEGSSRVLWRVRQPWWNAF
jgi:hypothetical protein